MGNLSQEPCQSGNPAVTPFPGVAKCKKPDRYRAHRAFCLNLGKEQGKEGRPGGGHGAGTGVPDYRWRWNSRIWSSAASLATP